MTPQEAREILAIYRFNLIQSMSNQLEGDIEALDMAIKALEQINCLTGRPCEVCEFHSDNGCRRWKCIFEEDTK
jgi:hypothetical protein